MSKLSELKIDVQGMREKILDLAMHGKLVSQDENDEPASSLLEKIVQEKEQLIKEKKIKKTKPLPEITDEEKPFEIPDSWEWVRLGEVSEKITDGTHNPPPNSRVGKQVISAINIKQNKIDFSLSNRFVTEEQFIKEDARTRIRKGDILLTIVGTIGNVAIVNTNQKFTAQRSIAVIKSSLLNKYLLFVLESPFFQKKMIKNSKGTTQKGIYLKKLNQLILPIPPLNEQKRIATKIEELFDFLDTIEESTKKYENLQKELKEKVLNLGMQGKLVEQDLNDEAADKLYEKIQAEKAQLIKEKKIKKTKPLPEITDEEKPFEIPDSWEWVRLGEVGNIFAGGDKPSDFSSIKDEDHPFEIFSNGVADAGLYGFTKKARVYEKSLTISARGTIGHVEIRKKPFLPIIRLITITPYISDIVNFLGYYLTRFAVESEGSSIPQLTVPKLKPKIIPLPPLNEQKRITSKIESLFNIIDD